MTLRAALVQLSVGDDPAANLPATLGLVRQAVAGGAALVLTPECTNALSPDRAHLTRVLRTEDADPTLSALREEAARAGVWVLAGSLGLKTGEARFANRSLLIAPDGAVAARYDKIHMFDVDVSPTEVYRESAAYRPGDRAVVAQAGAVALGLTVCYDLRFPQLHRALAKAGAQVLCVPSAFNHITGAAHWEVLLRARAIETGCFVLAPAQTGTHAGGRRTHGHSLAVAPWGEVMADGGTDPGVSFVEIDPGQVAAARARIPALAHDRPFHDP